MIIIEIYLALLSQASLSENDFICKQVDKQIVTKLALNSLRIRCYLYQQRSCFTSKSRVTIKQ